MLILHKLIGRQIICTGNYKINNLTSWKLQLRINDELTLDLDPDKIVTFGTSIQE